MSEDYTPYTSDRAPRSEGYEEETEKLFELMQEHRGDQRIGQFLINAVRSSEEFEKSIEHWDDGWKSLVETKLWAKDAPDLVEIVKEYVDGEKQ